MTSLVDWCYWTVCLQD
nr:unnamed protein product [Callosobruchus analis]